MPSLNCHENQENQFNYAHSPSHPLEMIASWNKKSIIVLADSNLIWAVAPLSLSSTPPTPQNRRINLHEVDPQLPR
jgi:hypothetical protein